MKPIASLSGILVSILAACIIGIAGSGEGIAVSGIPLFIICGLVAFGVQWLLFIPAWIFQTEKYFDLTGSLTYISLVAVALIVTGFSDMRAVLIGTLVFIWASRLGTFLFRRVHRDGGDRRFTRIKTNFLQFLMTWTIQGLWVYLTLAAGLAAMTSGQAPGPDAYLVAGLALWLLGFSFEVVADLQKSRFRSQEGNRNRFISTGLWRYSRHPNYFGEILLWIGIAVIAFPALQGWQYATLVSPLFVILLLTRISGINMLEARAHKQWGQDPDYQHYLKTTPSLIPRLLPR